MTCSGRILQTSASQLDPSRLYLYLKPVLTENTSVLGTKMAVNVTGNSISGKSEAPGAAGARQAAGQGSGARGLLPCRSPSLMTSTL